MKNTVRLSESQLINLIRKSIKEQENDRYMFFSNLEQIHRQTGLMLEMNENELHEILENGHDWAQDHIATAKESIDQVFDFFMNETKDHDDNMLMDEPEIMEGKKKTGTKLCARGKSAAKAKFKVYPSAYSNGFAVQVCQGRMKGLDGKKKCSSPYC
jgi:dsDNA-specific endonuclease/ATPase MutS2